MQKNIKIVIWLKYLILRAKRQVYSGDLKTQAVIGAGSLSTSQPFLELIIFILVSLGGSRRDGGKENEENYKKPKTWIRGYSYTYSVPRSNRLILKHFSNRLKNKRPLGDKARSEQAKKVYVYCVESDHNRIRAVLNFHVKQVSKEHTLPYPQER